MIGDADLVNPQSRANLGDLGGDLRLKAESGCRPDAPGSSTGFLNAL